MIILRLSILIITILIAGLLIFGSFLLFQPEWFFTKLRLRSPDVLYSVSTDQPVIALTIDDGPDPETTPEILKILAQWDAKATFFLITGHIPGNEHIVKQILSNGHEIGNHLTSDEPSIQLSPLEFRKRLDESDEILTQFGEIRWFRPGSGWYNDEMLALIQSKNYRCVLGSIYPYDPQISFPWFISKYVLWKLKPGSIIILHDHSNRGKRTIEVLEKILPEIIQRGYHLTTLSNLVALDESGD